VEEFQVVSVNYSAEYGLAMGGVVNTVTKSGSNALHGTAWRLPRRHAGAAGPSGRQAGLVAQAGALPAGPAGRFILTYCSPFISRSLLF
jgi:outer membrane receptor for ferrienterochelin and colicin